MNGILSLILYLVDLLRAERNVQSSGSLSSVMCACGETPVPLSSLERAGRTYLCHWTICFKQTSKCEWCHVHPNQGHLIITFRIFYIFRTLRWPVRKWSPESGNHIDGRNSCLSLRTSATHYAILPPSPRPNKPCVCICAFLLLFSVLLDKCSLWAIVPVTGHCYEIILFRSNTSNILLSNTVVIFKHFKRFMDVWQNSFFVYV